MTEPQIPFGRPMREAHFSFDHGYTPLNHGSYGAFPNTILAYQRELQDLTAAQPDTFIRYQLPELLIKSRNAIAPLLGVPADEVVFVPNATTGINTVLRNLVYKTGDVILCFSTAYGASSKSIISVCETSPAEMVCIKLEYPIEDEAILRKFRDMVERVMQEERSVKLAMFDTVLTFPGVRMPWEGLVKTCKELGILSLIDGAHGIGHIDLTNVGKVGPDFFTSNCYKWLYTPRGCAILHVPYRNQHLIRTSLPTSHGFCPLSDHSPSALKILDPKVPSPFVHLFAWVATIDSSPYMVVPKALEFRQTVCGGEINIRDYCRRIVQIGASKVADILGTEVMDNTTHSIQACCFANVRLPLKFGIEHSSNGNSKLIPLSDVDLIVKWIMEQAVRSSATYLPTKFHGGALWVRFSGQIYLEERDFEWAGHVLKKLCERIEKGEGRGNAEA